MTQKWEDDFDRETIAQARLIKEGRPADLKKDEVFARLLEQCERRMAERDETLGK